MVKHENLDKIGFFASTLCGLHCAAMPCLLMMFPFLTATFLTNELYERIFLLISAILAFGSVCFGYKTHKRWWIFSILSLAFFLLVVGHLYEDNMIGLVTLVAGGFMMAACHLVNWKLCKSCHTCAH